MSGPEYCIGLDRDILIENPSSWVAQWSEYKHHNTFKLLVGVTPNGTVTCLGRSTVLDCTEMYSLKTHHLGLPGGKHGANLSIILR